MTNNLIAAWGTLGSQTVREAVASASGPAWCVVDLMPTDELGKALFDARDELRDGYFAVVVNLGDQLTDASVLLAAVQAVLTGAIELMIIVASDIKAARQLLSMGERDEMLSVLAAIDDRRIWLWSTFDVTAFSSILAEHAASRERCDG